MLAARKLKIRHEDIELLKQKLLDEKSRRERVESELSKIKDLQANMMKLEDELSSWKSMIEDIPGVSCCDDIPVKFATLQKYVPALFLMLLCYDYLFHVFHLRMHVTVSSNGLNGMRSQS